VISGETNTVTATIPVGSFPEGAAADPKTNTVYVTNDLDNTVSVISGETNTVTATIPMGSFPHGSRRTRKPTPSMWPTQAATLCR
jgi:YVTN family beta-propeller protein